MTEGQPEIEDLIKEIRLEADEEGFVPFSRVSHKLLKQQAQYASLYTYNSDEEHPNLGEGLRFKGDFKEYATLKIHKDDIPEFVERVRRYRKETGRADFFGE